MDLSKIIPGTYNLEPFLDSNNFQYNFYIINLIIDDIQDRLLVSLRDGRNFFGILRSFDQFGKTIELIKLKKNQVLLI